MTTLELTLLPLRFLHFSAELFLFGGLLFPRYSGLTDARQLNRLARRLEIAAALAALSALGWFACVVIGMSDEVLSLIDPDDVWSVLVDTDFGRVWAAHFLLIMLLATTLVSVPSHPFGKVFNAVPLLLSAAVLVTQAMTGHTAAVDGSALWHVGVHSLHLLAAGLWLGGLPPLLFALRAAIAVGATSLAEARRMLQRFSSAALPAVVLLAGTGLANLDALGVLQTVWSSPSTYAWVMKAKLLTFALLLLLAASNRFLQLPRLQRSPQPILVLHTLSFNTRAEIVLSLVLIALIGALGMLAPPMLG